MTNPRIWPNCKTTIQINHKSIINLPKIQNGQAESIREKGRFQDPPKIWLAYNIIVFIFWGPLADLGCHVGPGWIANGGPQIKFLDIMLEKWWKRVSQHEIRFCLFLIEVCSQNGRPFALDLFENISFRGVIKCRKNDGKGVQQIREPKFRRFGGG